MPAFDASHDQRSHPPPAKIKDQCEKCGLKGGVHLIAGSGPHALQPLEHHLGGSVAFSLGNTVFDGPGPDGEWDRGGVLEITLDAKDCRLIRARVVETRTQPEK